MPSRGNMTEMRGDYPGVSDPFASEGKFDADTTPIDGELESVVEIYQDLESIMPVDILVRSISLPTRSIDPLLSSKSRRRRRHSELSRPRPTQDQSDTPVRAQSDFIRKYDASLTSQPMRVIQGLKGSSFEAKQGENSESLKSIPGDEAGLPRILKKTSKGNISSSENGTAKASPKTKSASRRPSLFGVFAKKSIDDFSSSGISSVSDERGYTLEREKGKSFRLMKGSSQGQRRKSLTSQTTQSTRESNNSNARKREFRPTTGRRGSVSPKSLQSSPQNDGFAGKISNIDKKKVKSLPTSGRTGLSSPQLQQVSGKDAAINQLTEISKPKLKKRTSISPKRTDVYGKTSKTQPEKSKSLPTGYRADFSDSLQSQSNRTGITDETSYSLSTPTDQLDRDSEGKSTEASPGNKPQKHLPRNKQVRSRRPSSMPPTGRSNAGNKQASGNYSTSAMDDVNSFKSQPAKKIALKGQIKAQAARQVPNAYGQQEEVKKTVAKKHRPRNSILAPSLSTFENSNAEIASSKPGAPKKHLPRNNAMFSDAEISPGKHVEKLASKKHLPRKSLMLPSSKALEKDSFQISDTEQDKGIPRKHLPRNSMILPSPRVVEKHIPRNSLVAGRTASEDAAIVAAMFDGDDSESSSDTSGKLEENKPMKEKIAKKKKKKKSANLNPKDELPAKNETKKKKKKNEETLESTTHSKDEKKNKAKKAGKKKKKSQNSKASSSKKKKTATVNEKMKSSSEISSSIDVENDVPKEMDVCFDSPSHEGTKAFLTAVQNTLEECGVVSYSPKIYRRIKKQLSSRRFFICDDDDNPNKWREVTKSELIDLVWIYYDKEKSKL